MFGIFGKLFLPMDPSSSDVVLRMRNAAWIDMVNMILWVLTAACSFRAFRQSRVPDAPADDKAADPPVV